MSCINAIYNRNIVYNFDKPCVLIRLHVAATIVSK